MCNYDLLRGKQVNLYLKRCNNVVMATIDGYVNKIILLKNVKIKHVGYTTTYDNAHVDEKDVDKIELKDE